MKTISLLTCCLLFAAGQAQTPTERQRAFLEAVAMHYRTADAYSMRVRVSTFDDAGNPIGAPQENRAGKWHGRFLTQTPMMTYLATDSFQLRINHLDRFIQLAGTDSAQQASLVNQPGGFAFSAADLTGLPCSFTEQNDQVIVRCQASEGMPAAVAYVFDRPDRFLKQVRYEYAQVFSGQPKRIVIDYAEVRFDEEVETAVFELDHYLMMQNEAWRPAGPWRDYEFINLLKTQPHEK